MNNRIAMFPGSFDPPTFGHLDIIERASKLFDKVFVVISVNVNKNYLFSAAEREELLKELVSSYDNVQVVVWNKLLVDFAKQNDIGVIIRGVRALNDFEYEFEIAQINKDLLPGLEIIFLPCDTKFQLVRSSYIKEMVSFGADIGKMVPEVVLKRICLKVKC